MPSTNAMFVLPLLAILAAALQGTLAVEYSVTNNAAGTVGGDRFSNEIGENYAKQTLASATDFIWRTFQQASEADRKNVPHVSLFIDVMDGVAYTILDKNEIHVSASYIEKYSGDLKTEITGVLYHEMTHVWQWFGTNEAPAPGGLTEGIADYVRLTAGYPAAHWVKPGQGDKWDQGYDVTARFLEYLEGLKGGFVAELNKKMRGGYSAAYFVELLGKTVDELWSDYKAKYNNPT